MLLTDLENLVRLDLFDPAGPNQRWSQADIDRSLDKAVERYSEYYPNIAYVDMPTRPWQRTYPYPTSWNASYPVLWIERILYPLQIAGTALAAPGTAPSASATSGSSLSSGSYQYAVTFLTAGGETLPSPIASVSTSSGNQNVTLSNIALGNNQPGGMSNPVIGRALYRSLSGGSTLYLLATLHDTVSSTFSDTLPDSALQNQPQAPTVNTSGIMRWPPVERAFSEFSNLFDSAVALAASGNLGSQGTAGGSSGATGSQQPTFTLHLASGELPQDSSLLMRIFYATRHQLDSGGSTIPEVHRDLIVAGASAYAMEAYQVPTNDNFDFQDGALHDRLDDTQIPTAWAAAAGQRMARFEARLQEIKQQRDYASAARLHWGDIPRYWTRL
ncbi:hypothetical protein [Dictyobacter formicarum]|uniref:Uncharacterized protein n=1 Tax=Dictyobacter formicarum TaxID=2778368 RepID=A0ABQ3VIB3_9CHLR|nr:hypothetical protein [Dictyobacter formicarum]GHO85795.1 hypothetical protein KSZ_38010 [Dictyobacter formicarum]